MSKHYELHSYPDEKFPIIFHRNRVYSKAYAVAPSVPVANDIIDSGAAHWHEGVEILYVVEGEGNIHINTSTLYASAGDIVVVGSNDLHRVSVTEGSCIYDCLIINYNICTDWGFDPCEISYDVLVRDGEIVALYEKLTREFTEQKPHYKSMVTALCMEIMAHLTRDHAKGGNAVDTSATKKAHITRQIMRYIARNIEEKITLRSISNDLKYSHFYLEHVFSELTGLSISEYLTQTRIREAKKLLLGSDLSLAEIAEKCGYSSPSAFSTAFRKRCDTTPKEYRKKGQ